MDTETLEKEMLPLLSPSARGDVKAIALEYFLGLTGTDDGRAFIGSSTKYLEAIISLTKDDNMDIVKKAYKSLINLTSSEYISGQLCSLDKYPTLAIDWLQYALKPDSTDADTICLILANMTRNAECARRLAVNILDDQHGVCIDNILEALCNLNFNTKADLHYLGSILSNLTQGADIRRQLMDSKTCNLQKLLPFVQFPQSVVRRAGIVGALRNCCFETDYHDWLLGDQVNILPRLLLPLAGPEEFDEDEMEQFPDDLQYLPPDKTREPDPNIRKMLVETVFQLCASKNGRLFIKEKNTYLIMREFHKWEKDEANNDAIMNLIDILIGDEPPSNMENLKDVDVPQDLQDQFEKEKEDI